MIDYFIESRGGTTVLRLVHSGFDASADFDAEYESTGYGWAIFMNCSSTVRSSGIDACRNVTILRMVNDSAQDAFEKLMAQAAEEMDAGVERHRSGKGHCVIEFPSRNGAMLQ